MPMYRFPDRLFSIGALYRLSCRVVPVKQWTAGRYFHLHGRLIGTPVPVDLYAEYYRQTKTCHHLPYIQIVLQSQRTNKYFHQLVRWLGCYTFLENVVGFLRRLRMFFEFLLTLFYFLSFACNDKIRLENSMQST